MCPKPMGPDHHEAGGPFSERTMSTMSEAKKEHTCATCGDGTCAAGHMCTPVDLADEECDWCGSLIVNERHMCKGKLPEVAYICNSCGRTAVSAEYLCKPEKIA